MMRAYLAAGLLLAMPAQAATTTLDFSGDICSGPCAMGSAITQSYGSTGGLQVQWRSLDGRGDAGVVTEFVRAGRPTGDPIDLPPFGSLATAAFADLDSVVGEARFTLAPGLTLTLLSIDTIVYDRFEGRASVFRIYDLDYNLLFASDEVELPQDFPNLVDLGGVSSTTGLILQWGGPFAFGDPDQIPTFGADQGISNLSFELQGVPVNPVVPEPGTWALMLAGFGLIGAAARRRRMHRG